MSIIQGTSNSKSFTASLDASVWMGTRSMRTIHGMQVTNKQAQAFQNWGLGGASIL
jgi:hypothetical protein